MKENIKNALSRDTLNKVKSNKKVTKNKINNLFFRMKKNHAAIKKGEKSQLINTYKIGSKV